MKIERTIDHDLVAWKKSAEMKKIISISIILMFVITICKGQNNDNTTKDLPPLYFPFGANFRDSSSIVKRKSFNNNWYSKCLRAMKEPVIYTDKSLNEVYRFTWLRSFHPPIAVRIEKQDHKYMLYWKACNGQGGYDSGELVINKQKALDERTWNEFINLLDQVDFWNLHSSARDPERLVLITLADGTQEEVLEVARGKDGAHWILEGKIAPQYHVVDRWSLDKKNNYYQCCDFLIQLTDLEISDKDKY